MASFSPPRRTGYAPQVDAQGNKVSEALPNEFSSLAGTRQQFEQQLVAAHRSGNVQAAQQAAYAIRAYDQNVLSAQVPSINAPPPIDRVPKPTFGSWLENVNVGIGKGLGEQVQGIGGMIERGVTAFAQDPLKASAAAFMTAVEPWRQGLTQPTQAAKDVGTGIVETGKQMYQQATSGPIGLGQTIGQMIDLPGPSLPGGKRRPTMAELDVYHASPHKFEPEPNAPLGKFRSEKIGTGEGAQAYGYGLYLAEGEGTAKHYYTQFKHDARQNYIAGNVLDYKGRKVDVATVGDPTHDAVRALWFNQGNKQDAIEFLEDWKSALNSDELDKLPDYDEAIKLIDSGKIDFKDIKSAKESVPSMYRVDLPDEKIAQMMDWDKPISKQPEVQKAFTKFWKGLSKDERAQAVFEEFGDYELADQMAKNPGEVRGRLAYTLMTHHFGDQAAASDFLRQQGVPGIKYLDAASRNSGDNVRNFVVFPGEEQNLTILERDGVKAEVPKAVRSKPTTWQGMSREEFLGDPKITTNRNAADLKPRALTTVVTEQPKPFKGNLTIRMNEDGAAVYDGDKVIASYNFGDTLVVDKKYRKQGIGEELIYQWRKANPTAPPAKERTKASQAIQEKVWQRLLNEQG